jgi:hypothetical protein
VADNERRVACTDAHQVTKRQSLKLLGELLLDRAGDSFRHIALLQSLQCIALLRFPVESLKF